MNDTQETIEITAEIQVVMDELSLPLKSIGVGITKGYEARRINPDAPAIAGNVIWAPSSHLDAFQDYLDREVLGAFEDAKRAVSIAVRPDADDSLDPPLYTQAQLNDAILKVRDQKIATPSPRGETKGWEAYERRSSGESWIQIGPNALNNAKSYAKAHSLPWPIKLLE